MGLYLLGFIAALLSAFVMKLIIRTQEGSYLVMEMPVYSTPKWSNIGYTILEKTKAFVFGAGKVILAISVILWVLASYGPALIDRALLDALCRVLGVSFYAAMRANLAGIGARRAEFAGFDWARLLDRLEPAATIAARHTEIGRAHV